MRAYLDHNATTPLRPEARDRWLAVAERLAGNASSLHAGGRAARALVDDARAQVAAALGVHEDEVVFTSGGTESNNLALRGGLTRPGRLVTTAVEHSAVLETARELARHGRELALLPVDRACVPDLDALTAALAGETALVSVMAANNETGAVPDLRAVRARLRAAKGSSETPIFHTDAVQALGRLPLDLQGWGVDLASFSAHKVGGPVGVGVLWRRRGVALDPLLFGGGQEGGLRPGTEDVAGIAAAALAIERAVAEREACARHTGGLVRFLHDALVGARTGLALVGPGLAEARLPNTLCLLVPETDGKVLVTRLDLEGVEVSAGSACASGSVEPSHVLLAMGYDEDEARAGLRVSLANTTSRAECEHAVHVLTKLVGASHAT